MDIEGSEIPSVYDVEPDQNNRVRIFQLSRKGRDFIMQSLTAGV